MKDIIHANNAPAAIGPYSQAVRTDHFIFTSGQIPIIPETGELESGDIKKQTRRVLLNLKEILKSAGADFSDVVKTTVFLKDMNDFKSMNEVYAEYFPVLQPARSAVQVARLPKGAAIEIEAIAVVKNE